MIRMPLKVGLPLLALLLLGLSVVEGRDQLPLILLAMGVALWTALSLPHPGPRPPPAGPVEESLQDAGAEAGREAIGRDEAGDREPDRPPDEERPPK